MSFRSVASNLVTGVLLVCALATAAAVVDHQFIHPTQTGGRLGRRHLAHPEELARSGNLIGSAAARIRLVEFSDFQCPYCAQLQLNLQELRRRHPGQIAVMYRHFPLDGHPQAMPAAIASECAAAQGRFAEFADSVFWHQDSLAALSWSRLADRAGVADTARFKTCLNDPAVRQRIATDVAVGKGLALSGTPAIIVGNELISGAAPVDTLERLIKGLKGK